MRAKVLSTISGFCLFALVSVGLIACGDSAGLSTSFGGIYEIASWNEVEEGCEGAGESKLEENTESDPLVLIDVCSFTMQGVGSESWIAMTPCSDEADCDAERCEDNSFTLGMGVFGLLTEGNDEAGWEGDDSGYMSSTTANENECRLRVDSPRLYKDENGVLTFEKRIKENIFEPINGSCTSKKFEDGEFVEVFDVSVLEDMARDLRATGDCTEMTVVTFQPFEPGS